MNGTAQVVLQYYLLLPILLFQPKLHDTNAFSLTSPIATHPRSTLLHLTTTTNRVVLPPTPTTNLLLAVSQEDDETAITTQLSSTVAASSDDEDDMAVWLTYAELKKLADGMNETLEYVAAVHADVAFYNTNIDNNNNNSGDDDDDDEPNGGNYEDKPTIYRLNRYSTLLQKPTTTPSSSSSSTLLRDILHNTSSITSTTKSSQSKKAQHITDTMTRWSTKFVQELNLCPWAKLSLQSKNGIRVKIFHQSLGQRGMERILRESAYELVRVTTEEEEWGLLEDAVVDVNAGITFVVAIREEDGDGREGEDDYEFQFESFYEFCTDLEDRLFDEADEAHEARELDDDGDEDVEEGVADILIGDEITIAPFHPDWYFATTGDEYEVDTTAAVGGGGNPLDYEKKSPYPTISLVRTSGIVQAGEEATSRIGIHNEEILKDFGGKRLKKLYNDNVLRIDRIK